MDITGLILIGVIAAIAIPYKCSAKFREFVDWLDGLEK